MEDLIDFRNVANKTIGKVANKTIGKENHYFLRGNDFFLTFPFLIHFT